MIDEKLKTELLASVNDSILNRARRHQIIATFEHINQIAGVTSGSLKFYPAALRKFELILAQPVSQAFNPFEIRCCLCRKVISYPAWYYSVRYAVNHFHYFVCFQSSTDNTKPNTSCYRRENV